MKKNAYVKLEEKRPFTDMDLDEAIILKMNIRETGCQDVNFSKLPSNMVWWETYNGCDKPSTSIEQGIASESHLRFARKLSSSDMSSYHISDHIHNRSEPTKPDGSLWYE